MFPADFFAALLKYAPPAALGLFTLLAWLGREPAEKALAPQPDPAFARPGDPPGPPREGPLRLPGFFWDEASPADAALARREYTAAGLAHADGRPAEAAECLERVGKNTRDPFLRWRAYEQAAAMRGEAGQPDRAVDDVRAALAAVQDKVNRTDLQADLCDRLIAAGRAEEAMEAADDLPRYGPGGIQHPMDVRYSMKRANTYLKAGRPEAATLLFLADTPPEGNRGLLGRHVAYGELLASNMRSAGHREAAFHFELTLLTKYPQVANGSRLHGAALSADRLGKKKLGDDLRRALIDHFPRDRMAAWNLAVLGESALKKGDRTQARELLRKALAHPAAEGTGAAKKATWVLQQNGLMREDPPLTPTPDPIGGETAPGDDP